MSIRPKSNFGDSTMKSKPTGLLKFEDVLCVTHHLHSSLGVSVENLSDKTEQERKLGK